MRFKVVVSVLQRGGGGGGGGVQPHTNSQNRKMRFVKFTNKYLEKTAWKDKYISNKPPPSNFVVTAYIF